MKHFLIILKISAINIYFFYKNNNAYDLYIEEYISVTLMNQNSIVYINFFFYKTFQGPTIRDIRCKNSANSGKRETLSTNTCMNKNKQKKTFSCTSFSSAVYIRMNY